LMPLEKVNYSNRRSFPCFGELILSSYARHKITKKVK